MIQAALVALIAFLAYMGDALGYSQYDRPFCTDILVSIALNDVQQGLMAEANLELVYMGTLTIGGAFPPDICAGEILGMAFAITTNSDIEGAVALPLPIATSALLIKQVIHTFVRGFFVHRVDNYTLQGSDSRVAAMHVWSTLAYYVPMAITVGICFYVGDPAVQTMLDRMPAFIMKGLSTANGTLSALGFVMLVKMTIGKELAPYFFTGFLIVSHLQISVLGIVCIAILIALLVIMNNHKKNNVEMGGIDNSEL